jgi:hypothetical protein
MLYTHMHASMYVYITLSVSIERYHNGQHFGSIWYAGQY